MGDVPILLKFNRLIKGPFGDIEDIWSKRQILQIKKQIGTRPWSKFEDIPQIRRINTELNDFDRDFNNFKEKYQKNINERLANEPGNLQTFYNLLPYGAENGIKELYLTERVGQYEEYVYLFKNLFPDEFKDLGDTESERYSILMNSCGSMFDYPTINPKSVGLGSLVNFINFFDKHYFSIDNHISNKYKVFLSDFVNFSGYRGFFNFDKNKNINRGINIGNSLRNYGFREEMEKFYNFNIDLWWGVDSTKNNFTKTGRDSYGVFFETRGLESAAGGRFQTYDLQEKKNPYSGAYRLDDRNYYLFSNNDATKTKKVFLYRTGKIEADDEIIFDEELSDSLNDGLKNNINKILYNYQTVTTLNELNNFFGLPGIYADETAINTNASVTGINVQLQAGGGDVINTIYVPSRNQRQSQTIQPVDEQKGGKKNKSRNKSKMKGGTRANILDKTSHPYLDARRYGEKFKMENYKKVLEKYKEEFLDKQNNFSIVRNIITRLATLPLFYHTSNDERRIEIGGANTQMNYETLRNIYLLSNILNTNCRLAAHFIGNYVSCLKLVKNKKVKHVRDEIIKAMGNSSNAVSRELHLAIDFAEYFDRMEGGIDALINNLERIENYFIARATGNNAAIASKDLFIGFSFKPEEVDTNEHFKTFIDKYMFVRTDGTMDKDKFKKLLMEVSNYQTIVAPALGLNRLPINPGISTIGEGNDLRTKSEYSLGGLPFMAIEPTVNAKIWACYWFILRWREESNKFLKINYTKFVNDKMAELDEKDMEKVRNNIDKIFTEEKMLRGISPRVPIETKKEFAVKQVLNYFYKKSLQFAEYIINQHRKIEMNVNKRNATSVRNLVKKSLKNKPMFYDINRRDIYKSINLFNYEIDLMIAKLRKSMGISSIEQLRRNSASQAQVPMIEAQYKWIVVKLRNLSARIEYLNRSYNFSNSIEKERILESVGFSLQEIQAGKIEDTTADIQNIILKQYPMPGYRTKEFWNNLYYKFNVYSGNKISDNTVRRLFAIGVRQMSTKMGKLSPVDIYLIDIFGAAMKDKEEWTFNNGISRDIEFQSVKGPNITYDYWSPNNGVITLKNYLTIDTNLYETKGSMKNKWYVFWESKGRKLRRLLSGDLYAYMPILNEFTQTIKAGKLMPLFLQGENYQQLSQIIGKAKQNEVYRISDKIISEPELMREWCYNLLFSVPNDFGVPSSNKYYNYAVPMDKIFFEKGPDMMTKGGLLKNIYKKIGGDASMQYAKEVGKAGERERLLAAHRRGNFISQNDLQNMGLMDVGK